MRRSIFQTVKQIVIFNFQKRKWLLNFHSKDDTSLILITPHTHTHIYLPQLEYSKKCKLPHFAKNLKFTCLLSKPSNHLLLKAQIHHPLLKQGYLTRSCEIVLKFPNYSLIILTSWRLSLIKAGVIVWLSLIKTAQLSKKSRLNEIPVWNSEISGAGPELFSPRSSHRFQNFERI